MCYGNTYKLTSEKLGMPFPVNGLLYFTPYRIRGPAKLVMDKNEVRLCAAGREKESLATGQVSPHQQCSPTNPAFLSATPARGKGVSYSLHCAETTVSPN